MKSLLGVLVVIVVVALLLGGCVISIRNGLVAKDETVKSAWSDISVQLQRRADLIPNLVNTVKGYAAHEKGIFESVSDARSRLLGAQTPVEKGEAAGALNSALGRLLAIAENYPNLKADGTFIRLQDELAGTENRIGVSRTRYNNAAKAFNAAIRMFPGSMFAPGMGLKSAEYFEIPESAKAVPEVKF